MIRIAKIRPDRWFAPLAIGFAALYIGGMTPADAQRSAPMLRQEINLPGHPNARCNDGTPPIIYFQAGEGDDRNKWIIYLQGGGGCATDFACLSRSETTHDLTSSNDPNLPNLIVADGILSSLPATNPDFAGYTHIYVHYCSSDIYAGDGDRMIGGMLWRFRGAEIVAATLDQLSLPTTNGTPSLNDATEVLIAGSSAGAMGVHNNLDRIAALLAPIKVKGFADSGWIPDSVVPFGKGMFDVRPDSAPAMTYYKGRPDDSCVAANPQNPGACMSENTAFKYITTPMFVYADQRDPQLLQVVGMMNAPTVLPETTFVYNYAKAVRDSLAAEVPAYFAPDTMRHTVLLLRTFNSVMASGTKLGDVLHAWYFGAPGPLTAIAPAPGTAGSVR